MYTGDVVMKILKLIKFSACFVCITLFSSAFADKPVSDAGTASEITQNVEQANISQNWKLIEASYQKKILDEQKLIYSLEKKVNELHRMISDTMLFNKDAAEMTGSARQQIIDEYQKIIDNLSLINSDIQKKLDRAKNNLNEAQKISSEVYVAMIEQSKKKIKKFNEKFSNESSVINAFEYNKSDATNQNNKEILTSNTTNQDNTSKINIIIKGQHEAANKHNANNDKKEHESKSSNNKKEHEPKSELSAKEEVKSTQIIEGKDSASSKEETDKNDEKTVLTEEKK